MTAYSISNPFPTILNLTGGGLNAGSVYIGLPNQDPEDFPQTVYWDSALTQEAAQPLATIGGYITHSASPATVYVPTLTYSIRVKDQFGQQIYYSSIVNDPVAVVVANLAAATGSSLIGFNLGATGAVDRTVQARLRDTVSVFDFIPVAQQAAIMAGTSTYDCTSDLEDFRDELKATGKTGIMVGGTYLVSTWTLNGSDYAIDTSAGVTFKQKTGLTGDAALHPILNFDRCENVTFGDAKFIGNIATDIDEYSHAVALQGTANVTLGILYGTNIRGDVLYVSGTMIDPTYGAICSGVSGTNIFRNLLSMAGGEAILGHVLNDGPVGYREFLIEPNAGGFYQPASLHIGMYRGGASAVVSADPLLQNGRLSIDKAELDWNLIQATTPAYPFAPGTNGIGLAISDVRSVHIGLLKVRDYKSYPISLGASWDSFTIDTLDVSNSNQTETTFNSVIVQQGTPGDGVLDIGYVKCVHTANTKWLVRSNAVGLKVRIGGGYVSGGLLSYNCVLDIAALVLDAGGATGGAANIVVAGSLSRINNVSISNAGSATLLYSSSGCLLSGITGTVNAIVSTTSNNNSITNSTINSKSYQYRIQSSDASAAVASAATVTLPLDRDVITISGTTNITSITAGGDNADRRVTLIFQGVLTVTDGSNLKLASNFVTSADDTMGLVCDGTNWYEVSRSAN